jgi:hypothetical protein
MFGQARNSIAVCVNMVYLAFLMDEPLLDLPACSSVPGPAGYVSTVTQREKGVKCENIEQIIFFPGTACRLTWELNIRIK